MAHRQSIIAAVQNVVALAAVVTAATVYASRRFNRIDKRLGDRLEAADFAEGYVHGAAGVAPPADRVN